ncbi:helix-turn-helix transcriptional regulator [Variovorax sp. PMC12]|uniref:helix-turn-helix transcriptional regulator n=1 Tax=Variovorax sp. PMC12 TaxID=2126319 RepID=UPI000D124B4D|nr:AlpA family transcriptional regulator [Variovorax sp. PMC12]AVQ83799.1 AlpA family transcriptional regulator [Variovorax sp. PMC12]
MNQIAKEKLLVPAAEAAAMLSMGRSTFWNKVKMQQLPQPVKIAGLTRWRVADLRGFVETSVNKCCGASF